MYRFLVHTRDICSSLLDCIAPRQARTMRTLKRTHTDVPLCPTSHILLDTDITTLMNYRDPAVQDLILSLKFEKAPQSAHLCAAILADFLYEEVATIRSFSSLPILLMPIPLHTSRTHERGFNQMEVVLNRLPRELRDGTMATHTPHILTRTKNTRPQTKLARTERIQNVRGAFAISDISLIKNAHVFIIDDVTTTGATLKNAASILRSAGARVIPIALARA